MSDLLDRLPYARFLGLTTATEGDALTVTMPFADKLIGNPMLPALHGGPTAALLGLTAGPPVARKAGCAAGGRVGNAPTPSREIPNAPSMRGAATSTASIAPFPQTPHEDDV